MGRGLLALSVSLVVHGLIGAGLWAYMEYVPRPVVLSLELSQVELSFSEVVAETAPVVTPPPAPEPPKAEPKPESPKAEPKPEPPKAEPKPEPPKAEPKPEPPKAEPKPEPPKAVPAPEPPKAEPKPEPPKPPAPPPVATPPAPQQARVDAPPRPRRTIRPDYPKGARLRGEEGNVVIELRVNAEGRVEDAHVAVSSGFTELDEAALKEVLKARFTPARSGRSAVAATARLTLVFRLK